MPMRNAWEATMEFCINIMKRVVNLFVKVLEFEELKCLKS